MSTKTIGFPSNPSLDQEHQGWVWDGEKWIKEGSESGAGMVISETEPTDKVEGMQWLNPTNGLVLFWDDEKWLQMPGSPDGADGKDGVDGVDGLWTDNGDTSISYTAGNVGIGVDNPTSSLSINTGGSSRVETTDGTASMFSGIWGAGKARIQSVNSQILIDAVGGEEHISFAVNSSERMRISSSDVILSQNTNLLGKRATGDLAIKLIGYVPGTDDVELITSNKWTVKNGANNDILSADASGRVDIPGTLYVNGTPKIGTVDMIKAFSKLRDAIKDEDTVESLKESITNCIGGLIEEWESMQSPATQEIER